MHITCIQTGGTIDKTYAERAGTYDFHIGEAAIASILEEARVIFTYEIISLLKKDSLDLTDDDRLLIARTCSEINSENIIITHGTDTMTQTAKVLSEREIVQTKRIILTGSSRPAIFRNSDATFNIGVAVGACSFLPTGVFIAMNGIVSPWFLVEKNKESGKFVQKEHC